MKRRRECHVGLVWLQKSEKEEKRKMNGLGKGRPARWTTERRKALEKWAEEERKRQKELWRRWFDKNKDWIEKQTGAKTYEEWLALPK